MCLAKSVQEECHGGGASDEGLSECKLGGAQTRQRQLCEGKWRRWVGVEEGLKGHLKSG